MYKDIKLGLVRLGHIVLLSLGLIWFAQVRSDYNIIIFVTIIIVTIRWSSKPTALGAEDAELVILIPVRLPCLEKGLLYKKLKNVTIIIK